MLHLDWSKPTKKERHLELAEEACSRHLGATPRLRTSVRGKLKMTLSC